MDNTVKLGLKDYEHVLTIALNEFKYKSEFKAFKELMDKHYQDKENGVFFRFIMELFIHLDQNPDRLTSLIRRLAKEDLSFSTSIHIFAEKFGLAYFSNDPISPSEDTSNFSEKQMERCRKGFKILMKYVKIMHDNGIKLRIGTDCRNGGKALLSEMLILNQYGFSMQEVFKIATIYGAEHLRIQDVQGSIEVGKAANLIIFEKNPFENPENLLANKTMIKNGIKI
jgi:hypothetical protein